MLAEKISLLDVNDVFCICSLKPLYNESCTESVSIISVDMALSFPTRHLFKGFGRGFGGMEAHSHVRGSVQ